MIDLDPELHTGLAPHTNSHQTTTQPQSPSHNHRNTMAQRPQTEARERTNAGRIVMRLTQKCGRHLAPERHIHTHIDTNTTLANLTQHSQKNTIAEMQQNHLFNFSTCGSTRVVYTHTGHLGLTICRQTLWIAIGNFSKTHMGGSEKILHFLF